MAAEVLKALVGPSSSVWTKVQLGVVGFWFLRSALTQRRKRLSQGQNGELNGPSAQKQLWRLRLICGCVTGLVLTRFYSSEWSQNTCFNANPSDDYWIGITFLRAVSNEARDVVGTYLWYPLELWWNNGVTGSFRHVAQQIPSDLYLVNAISLVLNLMWSCVPVSLFSRMWFVLVPVAMAFGVSSIALVGKLMHEVFPSFTNRIYTILTSKERRVRGTVLLVLALALVADAFESATTHHARATVIFGSLGAFSSLFSLQDLKVATNTTAFSSSVGLLSCMLIFYINGHSTMSFASYVGFVAASIESGLIPKPGLSFVPLWGLTILPVVSELVIDSPYSASAFIGGIGVCGCLVGMFAPVYFSVQMEEATLNVLDRIVKLGELFLFDLLLPVVFHGAKMISKMMKSLGRITGRWKEYVIPFGKWLLDNLEGGGRLIRDWMFIPLGDLIRFIWNTAVWLVQWIDRLLISPLRRVVMFCVTTVMAIVRGIYTTVVVPVGRGISLMMEIVLEAGVWTQQNVLVPLVEEMTIASKWIFRNLVQRPLSLAVRCGTAIIRFCQQWAIQLAPVGMQLASFAVAFYRGWMIFNLGKTGRSEGPNMDLLPEALMIIVTGTVFHILQRVSLNSAGPVTLLVSFGIHVAHWTIHTWMFHLNPNLFYGVLVQNRTCSLVTLASLALTMEMLSSSTRFILRILRGETRDPRVKYVCEMLEGGMDCEFVLFALSYATESVLFPMAWLGSPDWFSVSFTTLVQHLPGLWVRIQFAVTSGVYHSKQLSHLPEFEWLVTGIRRNVRGIAGGFFVGLSIADWVYSSSSHVPPQRLGAEGVVLARGLNLIGSQWTRLSALKRPWVVVNVLGRRSFRLSQPLVVFRIALEMGLSGLGVGGMYSGNDIHIVTRLLSITCAYGLVLCGLWMVGDVMRAAPLAEFGRQRFDSLSHLIVFGVNMVLHGSRTAGRALKHLGRFLLGLSATVWRQTLVPVLKTLSASFRFIWRNPISSWIASLGMLISLYQVNARGIDAVVLETIYSVVANIGTWGMFLVKEVLFWIPNALWTGITSSVAMISETELNFRSVLVSFPSILSLFIGLFVASYFKFHRHQGRWVSETRRIVFVPVLSTAWCYLVSPDLVVPVMTVTILWAAMALVVYVIDERERRGIGARLGTFRRAPRSPFPSTPAAVSMTVDLQLEETILSVIPSPDDDTTVFEAQECAICMDAMVDAKTKPFTLVCGHQFHRSCIATWLKDQNRCPLCREPVTRTSQLIRSVF